MNRTAQTRRNSRGFTLVELCVTLGIGAAVLGQAVPSMGKLHDEQLLRARSEALLTDLHLARSEAARQGNSVFFRVSGKGANACYVLHTGTSNGCDCAGGRAVCKAPGSRVIKAEWLAADQPVRITSNAETLEFQHRQGLVTQTGSIDLTLERGSTLRQIVAITGRVRTCSSSGALRGISKCA